MCIEPFAQVGEAILIPALRLGYRDPSDEIMGRGIDMPDAARGLCGGHHVADLLDERDDRYPSGFLAPCRGLSVASSERAQATSWWSRKKRSGRRGTARKSFASAPKAPLPSLSSLLCVVKRKTDSSRKRGSQTGLPAARIAVTLRQVRPSHRVPTHSAP